MGETDSHLLLCGWRRSSRAIPIHGTRRIAYCRRIGRRPWSFLLFLFFAFSYSFHNGFFHGIRRRVFLSLGPQSFLQSIHTLQQGLENIRFRSSLLGNSICTRQNVRNRGITQELKKTTKAYRRCRDMQRPDRPRTQDVIGYT